MSRWRAAAIHLALSAGIATVVLLSMYAMWYPPPYFTLMGGAMLVVLIVGCDVVLGPLITLIIFKAGKKGLVFDLATIAFVQALALTYGLYMMFESRPVFTVFAVDRFEVMSPTDFKEESLADARAPEYASFPLTGPRVVGAQLPSDEKEREKIMFGEFGGDLAALPRFYYPYDAVAKSAAAKAKPLATLEAKNPGVHDEVSKLVGKDATSVTLGYLPVVGRFTDMAMIVDTMTGRTIGIVDARPW